MTEREETRNLETIPVGSLGIIPLRGCESMAQRIDSFLVRWRTQRESEHKDSLAFAGYQRPSYLLKSKVPRFGSGEAKGVILESVRGTDLYLLVDVTNYSETYSLCGHENHMSPDDHYQDLKRIISAVGGKARRITVIMPFLYESRQHTYQFIKNLLRVEPDLKIDSDHMMVISPDEGGMTRAIYIANVLGLDMGMFYKRRDYTRIVNGRNPIVAHEFLGSSVKNKDMIVIDDMISSGESVLEVAAALKKRGARKIFICTTFGLFTNGLAKFDRAYENGKIDRVLTTNLIYQTPELLQRDWYVNCDMSKYIAYLIDTLNHDTSISDLLNPSDRIQIAVQKYKQGQAEEIDD